MKGRLGKAEVITAGAHKLARIVYALIATRKACDESEALKITRRSLERQHAQLLKQAQSLGFQLVPAAYPINELFRRIIALRGASCAVVIGSAGRAGPQSRHLLHR